MYLEEIISNLSNYWQRLGLTILPAYDMEVGAGTMAPFTFFGVLSNKDAKFCYVQPSRRPTDGRYGENPNRVFKHHQLQVIIKPSPVNIQDIYIESLASIGIDCKVHDIRFIEDNWESPTLGAWGVGWEVWLDGMEITQFTYFQQAGGINLSTSAVEITYGLERIAMYIQNKDSVYDIEIGKNVSYRDLRQEEEIEYSIYSLEEASIERLIALFELYLSEGKFCIEKGLIFPAFDYALKCSHTFNLLDSRGALSVTERARFIGRIRELSKSTAELFTRKEANE
jgi:glycyl-tRNA synthetase alpha chain